MLVEGRFDMNFVLSFFKNRSSKHKQKKKKWLALLFHNKKIENN